MPSFAHIGIIANDLNELSFFTDAARNALPDDGSYEPFAGLTYASGVQQTTPPTQRTAGLMPSTVLAGENSLTLSSGNVTFSDTSSTVKTIANTRFDGKVSVTGKNYVFKNCLFLGDANNDACFQCTNVNAENVLLEDCEIRGKNTNNDDTTNSDGLYGNNFTTRRVWIHGVVDGVHPNPDASGIVNWTDYGSVINGLSFYSPWQYQSNNASHNDCIQINGGHGIYMTGSKLEGFYDDTIGQAMVDNSSQTGTGNFYYPHMQSTSCLMGTPLSQPPGDYHFTNCWFDGGAYTFNFASDSPAYDQGVYFTNNIFGKNQRVNPGVSTVMVTPAAQSVFVMNGNTFRDGTAANNVGNS